MNLQYFLPNQDINRLHEPAISIVLGGILKYVVGGSLFDLVGHLLVFLGCLNLMYYLRKGKEDKINGIVSLLILGVLFIGIQVIFIQVFSNMFNIKPLLN